jgi:hypothetical protein
LPRHRISTAEITSTSSLIEATDNGMDLDFARVPDLLKNFTVNIHPNGTITLTPKENERKKYQVS